MDHVNLLWQHDNGIACNPCWWHWEAGGRGREVEGRHFHAFQFQRGCCLKRKKRKYMTAFKVLLSWKWVAFAEVVYQNCYTDYKQSRNVHYLPFHQFGTEAAGGKGLLLWLLPFHMPFWPFKSLCGLTWKACPALTQTPGNTMERYN